MAAMLSVMWPVKASSNTDAQQASPAQSACRPSPGLPDSPPARCCASAPLLRQASIAHESANRTKPADQMAACVPNLSSGSTASGYDSNASIEPRLESANRRYGAAPSWERAYQACTRGPVVESTKYGSPTLVASSPSIRHVGASPPSAFRAVGG